MLPEKKIFVFFLPKWFPPNKTLARAPWNIYQIKSWEKARVSPVCAPWLLLPGRKRMDTHTHTHIAIAGFYLKNSFYSVKEITQTFITKMWRWEARGVIEFQKTTMGGNVVPEESADGSRRLNWKRMLFDLNVRMVIYKPKKKIFSTYYFCKFQQRVLRNSANKFFFNWLRICVVFRVIWSMGALDV